MELEDLVTRQEYYGSRCTEIKLVLKALDVGASYWLPQALALTMNGLLIGIITTFNSTESIARTSVISVQISLPVLAHLSCCISPP